MWVQSNLCLLLHLILLSILFLLNQWKHCERDSGISVVEHQRERRKNHFLLHRSLIKNPFINYSLPTKPTSTDKTKTARIKNNFHQTFWQINFKSTQLIDHKNDWSPKNRKFWPHDHFYDPAWLINLYLLWFITANFASNYQKNLTYD